MGMTPVAPGELGAVVTWLEMRARPRPRPMPTSPLRLVRWPTPQPDKYRALFARVGAPWLWFSRLAMSDTGLTARITSESVEIYAAVDPAGIEVGLLELDFGETGTCNLAFFGLVPELTGEGHGRWLMAHALALGWRKGIDRMWVHTCTLDHPSALNFYRAQGFTPYGRALETFPDPRLAGILPRDAAPQIPLLGPST
jgi:GNAT superfamily N-acetyltransferase